MTQKFEKFGKYILLEKLASGGMAEVYLALSSGAEGIGKFVAIKRILPEYSNNKDYVSMFIEEAKVVMNLSHQNIVSIFEFGMESGQFFIVQEFIEGRNIKQFLNGLEKSKKPFSIAQIVYIAKEVAAGLDHSHNCIDRRTGENLSIIHQDISPQNIMLNYEGEIKVIDFGIAKSDSIHEQSDGFIRGKLGYLSPEQVELGQADQRSDVFSLGVMLWELLAKESLFRSKTAAESLKRICNCHVPDLTNKKWGVDATLNAIVQKATAKNRDDRYQSANEFYKELNTYLNKNFPAFSYHEIGQLVHGVYKDEIQERRKRMAEYVHLAFDKATVVESHTKSDLVAEQKSSLEETKLQISSQEVVLVEYKAINNSAPKSPLVPPHKTGDLESPKQVESNKPPDSSASNRTHKTTKPSNLSHSQLFDKSSFSVSQDDLFRMSSSKIHRHKHSFWSTLTPTERTVFVVAIALLTLFSSSFLIPTNTVSKKVLSSIGDAPHASTPEPSKTVSLQKPQSSTTPAPTTSEVSQKNRDPEAVTNIKKDLVKSDKSKKTKIYVRSLPQGAEVLLNRRPTGQFTPAILDVENDQNIVVGLKLKTYEDYESPLMEVSNIPENTFDVTLKKSPYAWLTIDVYPRENTQLYLNGQLLGNGRFPIQSYKVRADQKLVLTARNRKRGAFVTQDVNVTPGEAQKIYLTLEN